MVGDSHSDFLRHNINWEKCSIQLINTKRFGKRWKFSQKSKKNWEPNLPDKSKEICLETKQTATKMN